MTFTDTHIFDSTNLSTAHYDPNTATLLIHFHNGSVYQYDGVSHELWAGLITAESAGRYFHAVIRPLPTIRLRPPGEYAAGSSVLAGDAVVAIGAVTIAD